MTDDTRRMVEETLHPLLHAMTMAIRQRVAEDAERRVIAAVVALVERERADATRDGTMRCLGCGKPVRLR